MTSSPATTPPCLGRLRLELPLSSSPRKVAILAVLWVRHPSGWVQVLAWGVCIALNISECVCVGGCVGAGTYMHVQECV